MKHQILYAIVGGHTVALHGAVRGTMDVDIICKWTLESLIKLEALLKKIGLVPRLPIRAEDIFHFKEEYVQNRNLLAWNFFSPTDPTKQLDIVLTRELDKVKTKKIKVSDQTLTIISKNDLTR